MDSYRSQRLRYRRALGKFFLTLAIVSLSAFQSHTVLRAQKPVAKAIANPAARVLAKSEGHEEVRQRILDSYGRLPLTFELNQGQTSSDVKFLSRGSGYTLFLTPREAVVAFAGSNLRMKLIGASGDVRVDGVNKLAGTSNYFRGKDSAKWLTGVPHFDKVRYENVYRGIDLIYYGVEGQLKYDFVIAPGADPREISLAFDGAEDLVINDAGDLILSIGSNRVEHRRPFVYQEIDAQRQTISGRYIRKGPGRIGFQIDAYDNRQPLIIDPAVLVYSTFLGGSSNDSGFGIAVDAAGNAYITGSTESNNFPTTAGSYDSTYNTNRDAYVTKLNPLGTTLLYSTFLGGGNQDEAFGSAVAVDASGNAFVTGRTLSSNFPTTPLAFDTSHNGGDDGFVTQLNPTGSTLVYSTFLGGSGSDIGRGIAVDAAGNAHITGRTESTNFPTTPTAFDPTHNNSVDAFVTKLNPAGTMPLVYSSYLGGTAFDEGFGIDLDAAGDAYVTGATDSSDFPISLGAYDVTKDGIDIFVTKINTIGTAPLLYSTFVGGGSADQGFAIAVDPAGNAHVTGVTASSNFPTTSGAFDTLHNGGDDAFATKLNLAGSGLVYSTFLGGSSADIGFGIAVDSVGNGYLTGYTESSDFPLVGAFDTTRSSREAFVTKLNTLGTAAVYSTYLGGNGSDAGRAIALDSVGNAHVTGMTSSGTNFPIVAGSFDTSHNGNEDAFVAKIADTLVPVQFTITPAAATNPVGTQHCVTATVRNFAGTPLANVRVRFTVTGSTNTTGAVFTNTSGQATFCYNGPTLPGADAITAYADSDNDNTQDPGEPSGAATKTWIPTGPATLVLDPAADSNPVVAQHCVSAHVRDVVGNPVPKTTVRFTVTGSVMTSGVVITDAAGKATFCYNGPSAPGVDSITAYADADNDAVIDVGEPTGVAAKTWHPGAPATVTIAPVADENPVGTQHCVVATVRDIAGNPVPKVTVRFTVTGSTTTSGTAVTDATGQAQFCYTGPLLPGANVIQAHADTNGNTTVDPGEPQGTATKTWLPGTATSLRLDPLTATNPVATQHCVTARVQDAFFNPVPKVTVRFTVTGAVTGSAALVTDANGEALFCYMGPKMPGIDVIRAFADSDNNGVQDLLEPGSAAEKTWAPGNPATVTLDPKTDTNPVGTEHCVTATVRDALMNPIPNVVVRFSVTGAVMTNGFDATNAAGVADFCYDGPTTPGADVIDAYADADNDDTRDAGEPVDTAEKTWVPGAPASLTLDPLTDTNPVGTDHCVIATARDAFGNPVPNVIVRFTVTGSVMTGGSATTNANGQAEFCYDGPTAPGADAIEAFADTNSNGSPDAGEPAAAAEKTWVPGDPATVTLTPPTATNQVGTQHCVVATVEDALGNPVPNVVVRFAVTGAAPTGGTATTDATGQARFCYSGPQTPGVDAIRAFADTDGDGTQDATEPQGAAEKTWVPGDPASLTIDPAQDANPVGTQHCVTATVRDGFGNPVPNVIVRFTVTGTVTTGGADATDASGEAQFCYTGPTTPGADTITAYADTDADELRDPTEPTGAAEKTWVPGNPATVTLTPVTATNPVGTQHCVVATVRDAFGNPVPNAVVRFSVVGVAMTSGSATTNATGQAQFCYMGPTTPGTDAISAYADTDRDNSPDSGEPAAAASKIWIPGLPATVTLDPAASTNPVDSQHCVVATVRDAFGNPVPNVTVRFNVTGSVMTAGSAATNASGQAQFCYMGPPLPGQDAITAFADTNNNGTLNPGEPTGAATKTWVLPVTTPLCDISIHDGGRITAANGDRATFGGNAKASAEGDVQGQQQYHDHGPAQPMNVHSIEVLSIVCESSSTQASIYGRATIDGAGSFFYRIRVQDLGEPGRGQDTYSILLSPGYSSGEQVLEGGNIQIHRR